MTQLEEALIDEFLRAHHHDRRSLLAVSEGEMRRLLADASIYASSHLAEIEARAHYVRELHGDH